MRKLILIIGAVLFVGCGAPGAASAAPTPIAIPTPNHKAYVEAIKPKAVALHDAATALSAAYAQREVATIRKQLPVVKDAADNLYNIVFSTKPTPPELTSAEEDCIAAATDGRELARDWDDAIQRGDIAYLAESSWLNSLLRDSDNAVKGLK